jgi:hypothetical protein
VESLNLLKQEINQTLESEHDFAKWKLIVVAALGGAALGPGKDAKPQAWILLFIPFACAFIDLHLSQYQARILVLAQFIRSYVPGGGAAVVDTTLRDYEEYCGSLRLQKKHIFDLGQFANSIASIGLSMAAALVAMAASWKWPPAIDVHFWLGGGIWVAGIAAICIVWISNGRRLDQIKKAKIPIP